MEWFYFTNRRVISVKLGLFFQEITFTTEFPGSSFLLPTVLIGSKWDFQGANLLLATVDFEPLSSHVGVEDISWGSFNIAVAGICISATAALDDMLLSHVGVADIYPGRLPGLATYFRFSFPFFKKGSFQLLAKVCARSTG